MLEDPVYLRLKSSLDDAPQEESQVKQKKFIVHGFKISFQNKQSANSCMFFFNSQTLKTSKLDNV